jgi:hypothetical protein
VWIAALLTAALGAGIPPSVLIDWCRARLIYKMYPLAIPVIRDHEHLVHI